MNLAEKMKKAMQGVKVVDKVDLENIPSSSRPDKPSKADKKLNREFMTKLHDLRDEAHNVELLIAKLEKQYDEEDACLKESDRANKQLRKDFLECRMKVREKYNNLTLSNADRQKTLCFMGLRPSAMDIVKIALPPEKGGRNEWQYSLALVRDENHYYVAIDLFPHPEQEDNLTTCMDDNPDGTFEGIWPKNAVLQEASKFEERMMRMLVDKYADDIEKAKAYVESAQQRDMDESSALAKEINDLTEAVDAYGKIDAQLQEKREQLASIKEEMDALTLGRSVAKPQEEEEQPTVAAAPEPSAEEEQPITDDAPDLTDYEQRYPHLVYIRGKRNLEDMSYPFIEADYKPWLRFRLMSNVARLFDKVATCKPLTYVLSGEYMEELKSRAKSAYHSMLPQYVVAENTASNGVLVFNHQGCDDTIVYHISNFTQITIIVTYIREGKVMFYESYNEQQIIGRPRVDSYMCDSMRESGTDVGHMFSFVRNLVVSFLAMERDMELTMRNFVSEGKGSEEVREIKPEASLRTDLNEDVVIRDSNWYLSVSIDHLIPVQGYVSHRWCGKGKEKVLQEVWVRPHARNGYHREAGVTKQSGQE